MNKTKLANGVYTATLTPLKKDRNIDFDLLVAHCNNLLQNGSTGIALLGTTGEANSFSVAERKKVLKRTLEGGINPSKIMIGTGCCSLPESVSLTKHALKQGVNNILFLPPFYYKQVEQRGLLQYMEAFIKKVKDENLRIYLYHFPKMSGLPFSIPLIKQLKEKYPQLIMGIKDSSGDFENMKAMVRQIPDFQVFAGTEKYLLDILKIGGAGCISATCNVTVNLASTIFQLWKTKKTAKEEQAYLSKVRSAFEGLPFTGALKAYLSNTIPDKRWLNIRPPNELIKEAELQLLMERLEQLKFS